MKTIAVLSQKGGSGKTTTALHLAVASELAGRPAAVIDLDPQVSSASWAEHRAKVQDKTSPAVVSFQAARLSQALQAASQAGASFTLIDTAPHSEQDSLAAARAADLLVIPCRPAILDLRAIRFTIDLAALAGKPVAVVLNTVPAPRLSSRDSQADKAAKAIASEYQVPVCPVRIVQRMDYVHALAAGLTAQEYAPRGKAAQEAGALYRWVWKRLNQ
jgi:chromosome partitioning protein